MKVNLIFPEISEKCRDLINEMSREIGKINIYDIYAPCYNDMDTVADRAR